MTDIDPLGLLRAENATMRNELEKSAAYLQKLVERCKAQDNVITGMASHMAIVLTKHGGSIVLTNLDRAAAAEMVVQGYRTEAMEDDRLRLFTVTPEEFDEQKKREALAEDAGGQAPQGPRLIEP